METFYEPLTNLGYFCQEPSVTDKTYFFVRHTETTTYQIWIIFRKKPIVEFKINYKISGLDAQTESAIADFISDMGFDEYSVIEPDSE